MVSDGEDLSTADLLRRIGAAMGRPVRLFNVPSNVLNLCSIVVNKHSVYQRLCGTLQVDIKKTRQVLGWEPSVSVDEGLRRAVVRFCNEKSL